jgi:predicted nucleic acid-binding protein
MRLVIDANVLVAELLRARGQELLAHPDLRLSIAEHAWGEVEHELRKRLIARFHNQGLSAELVEPFLSEATAIVRDRIHRASGTDYARYETVARRRIPRDPDDWHTVALALSYGAYNADIWTNDGDFLGCGIATWTTETLLAHLAWLVGRGAHA